MSSATLAKTPLAPPDESAAGASNAFVINLVSSTTPVALTRPDHAGLRRFTFFVSRRREEGRERFRLHMGYFDTQEEAEQLLDIVRSIYPGAWAGLAPGRRLAAAAAAAAAATAAVTGPVEPPAPIAPVPTPIASAVTPPVSAVIPTVPVATVPTAPAAAQTASGMLALVPDEGRRPLADVADMADVPASTSRTESPHMAEQRAARHSLSNIRAAIASLEDSGIRSPVLDALPELQAAVIPVAKPAKPAAPANLTDTATLRLLESGGAAREPSAASKAPSVAAAAPKPTVDPVGSARIPVREAARDEKPCYAVQLVWSVQSIDMAQVPQLAIFSAYTLYGAEGNRDGRRWYGLRLGFFTDAVSAKQVAQYVRADFATVSVVPVTGREREQAQKAIGAASTNVAPAAKAAGARKQGGADTVRTVHAMPMVTKVRAVVKGAGSKHPEFAFIEGMEPRAATAEGAKQAPAQPTTRTIGGRPTRGAPGKRVKVRKPGQIDARTPVKPKTLEETLEILGANQLQVDDEPGPSINDSGVRHLRLESAKSRPSKLSRLIGRLSERMGS